MAKVDRPAGNRNKPKKKTLENFGISRDSKADTERKIEEIMRACRRNGNRNERTFNDGDGGDKKRNDGKDRKTYNGRKDRENRGKKREREEKGKNGQKKKEAKEKNNRTRMD